MKILYIYDDPNNFVCTENWIEYALKQNGHHVDQISYQKRPHQLANSYDFVLFSKVRSPDYNFRQFLRATHTLTVCWLFDLFIDIPRQFKRSINDPQFGADLVFTTDGGHDRQWRAKDIEHNTLRQGIHEPEHFLWENEKEHDVAFIGHPGYYNYRDRLLKFLKRKDGITFEFTQNTYGIKLNELLSKTKIVVGDSYPSPHYWSNRVYEITGRGGFLIMPKERGLDGEFSYNEEIAVYERGDFSELSQVIDYYLEHDKERKEIKYNGFKRCGDYTYQDRCEDLISKVKQHV